MKLKEKNKVYTYEVKADCSIHNTTHVEVEKTPKIPVSGRIVGLWPDCDLSNYTIKRTRTDYFYEADDDQAN